MKSYLLTESKDTLVGMRLAGVKGEQVESKAQLLNCIRAKMADNETGILIITSKVVDLAREEIMSKKLASKDMLIIEIPSAEESFDNDYITRYIRESIGVKI